ncbi:MAG TPA: ABC transporter substrate-binding protein [Candidatus Nitrosotalea sp.]|nr:ABC transporter substrate-binding protein [Candidatus Nitrosotalea sp.]
MNWLRANAMVLAMAGLVAMTAAPATAGVATDQLRGAVDRVLKTLEDPLLKGEAKVPDRRAAVRKIANEIFDFGEIAKRSLARHWQPLSETQRNEFVGLFADLLERSYISKIETYGGEKIQYTAERTDGDYATVSTKIITKNGTEVPVDYRMVKRGERWLVYDVSIEGVSLVSNYRTQFNKIIQTSSYSELVSKLRSKQDELLAEDKGQKKKL